MVDQFVVVPFTTPASTGTFDITTNAITETVNAVVLIYGSTTTDDSDIANARMGIGMYAEDGLSVGGELQHAIAFQIADAQTTTQLSYVSKFNDAILARLDGTGINPVPDIEAAFDSFISGGVRLNAVDVTGGQISGTAILFAGVARAHSDAVTVTTSLQTELTGGLTAEFQPDLVILIGHDGAYSSPTRHSGACVNLGFITADDTVGQGISWNHGVDPSDADGYVASGRLVSFNTQAGGRVLQLCTASIVSTGFQHQVTTGTGSPDMAYVAIKFSGSVSVKADNFAVAASSGAQSFSAGFPPSVVFGLSSLISTEDSATDGATASVAGFSAFDSGDSRAYAVHAEEGVTIAPGTPANANSRQGSYGLLNYEHQGTVAQQGTSALTSTGFSLTFSTAPSAGLFTAIAIGGGSLELEAPTETVVIGDDVGFWTFLEVDTETVVIGDALGNTVTTKAVGNAPTLGTTAQARSQQGRTVGSHSELGRTEG